MTWNYIAGFFDGEGSIVHNGKGYRITISRTNKKVFEEIKNHVGFGYIIKPNKRKSHWKDSWVYYIAKQEEVLVFIRKILPYLIIKKNQALRILPVLEKNVEKINKKRQDRQVRIKEVKELRNQGLKYRQIGKRLDIDFGYARRLALDID